MTWLFNVSKEYSCQRTLLILGGKDESGVRSCHSCSTHGCFIVHLQVFGIISGVVMVIILYSRTSRTPSYCEIESVRPRGRSKLDETILLWGRKMTEMPWKIELRHTSVQFGWLVLLWATSPSHYIYCILAGEHTAVFYGVWHSTLAKVNRYCWASGDRGLTLSNVCNNRLRQAN